MGTGFNLVVLLAGQQASGVTVRPWNKETRAQGKAVLQMKRCNSQKTMESMY
jgi:hypothetical protein